MSRPVGSKNKSKPKSVLAKTTDAAPVKLTSDGQQLFDDVSKKWVLNVAAERLLRLSCEAISESQRYNEILEETGRHYQDRFGVWKPNEISKMEASHRSSAMSCLAKLIQSLE